MLWKHTRNCNFIKLVLFFYPFCFTELLGAKRDRYEFKYFYSIYTSSRHTTRKDACTKRRKTSWLLFFWNWQKCCNVSPVSIASTKQTISFAAACIRFFSFGLLNFCFRQLKQPQARQAFYLCWENTCVFTLCPRFSFIIRL